MYRFTGEEQFSTILTASGSLSVNSGITTLIMYGKDVQIDQLVFEEYVNGLANIRNFNWSCGVFYPKLLEVFNTTTGIRTFWSPSTAATRLAVYFKHPYNSQHALFVDIKHFDDVMFASLCATQ